MANSLHSPDGNPGFVAPGQEQTRHDVVQEPGAHDACANKPKMGGPDVQEIPKKQEKEKGKCGLKIQVIDDTALLGRGKFNGYSQEIKMKKKPKRKVRKARRKKENLEKGVDKKGKERLVLTYSRKEMEVLRFKHLEYQKQKWIEVYGGLDASVARECDGLVASANVDHKSCNPSFNFDAYANMYAVAAVVKANQLKIIAH